MATLSKNPKDRTASAPTKLELLQQNYRHKLSRERDRKIQELHQDPSYMSRFEDSQGTRVSVREFFEERRKLKSENGYVPEIEQHYKQKRSLAPGYTQKYQQRKQEGYETKPAPAPHIQKSSAGRDRANLLAPISKPSSEKATQQAQQTPKGYKQNFINSKPRQPVRNPGSSGHHSGPVASHQSATQLSNHDNPDSRIPVVQYQNKTKSFREWRQQQPVLAPQNGHQNGEPGETSSRNTSQAGIHNSSRGVTKNNSTPTPQPAPEPYKKPHVKGVYGVKKPPPSAAERAQAQRRERMNRANQKRAASLENDEPEDDTQEMLRKQEELMQLIEREQAELKRIQQERTEEDAKARREADAQKKRLIEKRDRQRRLQQERLRKESETEEMNGYHEERQRGKISADQAEQDRLLELELRKEMQAKYGVGNRPPSRYTPDRPEEEDADRPPSHKEPSPREQNTQRRRQMEQQERQRRLQEEKDRKRKQSLEDYVNERQQQRMLEEQAERDRQLELELRNEAQAKYGVTRQRPANHFNRDSSPEDTMYPSKHQRGAEPVFPSRARVIRSNTRQPPEHQSNYDDYQPPPHREPERHRRTPPQAAVRTPPRHRQEARQRTPVRRERTPVRREPPREPSQSLQDFDEQPVVNRDDAARFYAEQALRNPDAHGKADLVKCPECGKKFARDRIEKHRNACRKMKNSKRKVFDPVKMRNQGTDFEKYAASGGRRPRTPPPPKSNWRAKHEDFMQTVRYARQAAAMEKQGQAPPPPPKSKFQEQKTKCPHCDRAFNPDAAERHIPICSKLKTKKSGFDRRR